MTVKELRKLLDEYCDDTDIVISAKVNNVWYHSCKIRTGQDIIDYYDDEDFYLEVDYDESCME